MSVCAIPRASSARITGAAFMKFGRAPTTWATRPGFGASGRTGSSAPAAGDATDEAGDEPERSAERQRRPPVEEDPDFAAHALGEQEHDRARLADLDVLGDHPTDERLFDGRVAGDHRPDCALADVDLL